MEIARTWRQQASNLRLVGCRCRDCEALIFPERVCCPECSSRQIEPYSFRGRGEVISVTTVREAPHGFDDQVPYMAALVRLDEGPVIATMLTEMDPGEARVGQRVEMVTRRIRSDGMDGPILYGYKFQAESADERG